MALKHRRRITRVVPVRRASRVASQVFEQASVLNIDLDVRSRRSLAALAAVWPWAQQPYRDSRWLVFSARGGATTADGTARELIEQVKRLPPAARRAWNLASSRTFRAVHDDQSRSNTPRELTLEFTLRPNIGGPFDFKPPHVVFVVDDGQASAGSVEYSINGQPLVTMGISSVSIEPFALADLARLERATTLRGRLFNSEFALTPEQICSIREFSQGARQRPNKPGAVF